MFFYHPHILQINSVLLSDCLFHVVFCTMFVLWSAQLHTSIGPWLLELGDVNNFSNFE